MSQQHPELDDEALTQRPTDDLSVRMAKAMLRTGRKKGLNDPPHLVATVLAGRQRTNTRPETTPGASP